MNRAAAALSKILSRGEDEMPGVVRAVYPATGRAHVATRLGLMDCTYSEALTVGQRVLVSGGAIRPSPVEVDAGVYWV